MKITIGKKSMVKLGKWGLVLLSVILLGYFFVMYVIPVFGTIDTTNSYVNTTTAPQNWTKNGTSEWVNFTIKLSNGNVTHVNITVPNTTTLVNFSVDNVTNTPVINDTRGNTWHWEITENRTDFPGIITFNITNATAFTSADTIRFDLYVTAQVEDSVDVGIQDWNISVLYNDTQTINRTTVYTYVDSRTPVLNQTTPGNGSYITGSDSQLFEVYVYDDNFDIASKNASLYWKAFGAGAWLPGSGESNMDCELASGADTTKYLCNKTVDDLYDVYGEGITFNFLFNASDNFTYTGYNGTLTSLLNTTTDITAPTNTSTSLVKVSNGTKYDTLGTTVYGFQMDWTDSASGVYNVTFESNFSAGGTNWANTTAAFNGSDSYSVNFTSTDFKQADSIFGYRWYANDSVTPDGNDNQAVSDWFYYTIDKADNPVDLLLNDTKNANVLDLQYPNTTNATGNVTGGEVILLRNVSGTFTDVSTTENQTNATLPVGVHAYLVNTTGNANYSANNTDDLNPSFYIIVSKGFANVTLLFNDTAANTTIASGDAVNITAIVDNTEGVVWLYNETGGETSIANESAANAFAMNITTWVGTPDTEWNITGYYNGSQNYTNSSIAVTCSQCNYYIKIESTLPTFDDNSTNVSATKWGKYQGLIGINAAWNDNFNLSRVWMFNNTTTSWGEVYSTFGIFGPANSSNFTLDASAVDVSGGDVIIAAAIYANDTSNNTNYTNTFTWTIDGTDPILNNTYPANNSYASRNGSYPFHVSVIDHTLNVSNATLFHKKDTAGSWNSTSMTCTGTLPSYTCTQTGVNLDIYAEGDEIWYYYEASDNSSLMGSNGTASNPLAITLDSSAPVYALNGTNETVIGMYDGILIYANWTDLQGRAEALDTFIVEFSTPTDAWNVTEALFSSLGATNTWSNYSYDGNSSGDWTAGVTIGYRIYANDSVPYWNISEAVNFTIDNTAPPFYNNGSNVTNDTTIARGAVIEIYANWTDNTNLSKAWVQHNFTAAGTFTNASVSFGETNWTNQSLTTTSSFTLGGIYQGQLYVNDTTGNVNNTGLFQWIIDGTLPSSYNNGTNVTNDTTIVRGTVIEIYANWTDDLNLSEAWVQHNFTVAGTFTNTSVGFGDGNWTNQSLTTTSSFTLGGIYQAQIYANDTSGNVNNTILSQWTIDGTAPTPANFSRMNATNTSASANGSMVYAPSVEHTFNVSWTDNLGFGNISIVLFNISYNDSNYTAVTLGLSNFSVTLKDLPVGDYWYEWYANDTSNNWNRSSIYSFNVTTNASTGDWMNLTINSTAGVATQASRTVTYPLPVNVTGYTSDSGAFSGQDITFTLYRNDGTTETQVGTGDVTESVVLGNATHNYTYITEGNANYSLGNKSYNVLVLKRPTNMTLWINGDEGDKQIELGVDANFTATITNGTYSVWLNITTNITAGDGWVNQTALSVGNNISNLTETAGFTTAVYNITAHFDGDSNHTNSSVTYYLTIADDTTAPSVVLFDDGYNDYDFNNSTAVKSGSTININASISDSGVGFGSGYICNVTLVLDGTDYEVDTITYSSGWCNKTVTIPAHASLSGDGGSYKLNVSINDTNNNWGRNNTFNITIDNTPPVLAITFPTMNGTFNKSDSNTSVWINGTITDNLQMGVSNVSINGSYFTVYEFSGSSASAFSFSNTSTMADGLHAFIISYDDNATNSGNITTYFTVDNTPPSAVYGLTNSSSQSYGTSLTQTIEVLIEDAQQTNETITLNYHINGSWQTTLLTGTPGTSTTYSGTISTLGDDYKTDRAGRAYIPYYVNGIDNATNPMSASSGNGTTGSPLANLTLGTTGTIEGTIFLTNTTLGVGGVHVYVPGPEFRDAYTESNTTGSNAGHYILYNVIPGTRTVIVDGNGYYSNSTSVTVEVGETANANMSITGAESFNVTIPGSATASATVGTNGFLDSGWHSFWLDTGTFSDGTTNYTIERLFWSIGHGSSWNYSSVWRFNRTTEGWASYIPQETSTLINVTPSDEHYYVRANGTDRVEIEPRYT